MKQSNHTELQKKKILVGIHQLDQVGGAELYTYDLLKELSNRPDLQVEYFTHKRGKLASKVEESLGIPFMQQERYDLILATHNAAVDSLHERGTTVQICHGAILPLEHPSLYADYHVGITAEVCHSLSQKGYPNALIFNGIDIQQKNVQRPVNQQLKTVLSLCQSEQAAALIEQACQRMGLEFMHFNKHRNPAFDIQDQINKADLVVGIGRSIFDAMACGRACLVFDARDYNGNKADGYLQPELFAGFIKHNCSGRYRNLEYTADDILQDFLKYRPQHGAALRAIAVEQLNVRLTAEKLLQIPTLIDRSSRRKKRIRLLKLDFKTKRRAVKKKLKSLFNRSVRRNA